MKTMKLTHEARNSFAIQAIAIILCAGFMVMTGLTYDAEAAVDVIYVADMQASLVEMSTSKSAQVTVTIADQYNTPVEGVTVSGAWSGLVRLSVSGVTGANGKITFISRSTRKIGTIAFDVTGVSADGYSYDASQNALSSISISTSEPINLKPVADIVILPGTKTVGIAPLAVSFDGSGSYDPDGSIVSYQWDFGDGSTAVGETAAHTYTVAGIFTVTLTVKDDKIATGTTTTLVTATSEGMKTIYVSYISLSVISNKNRNSVNAVVYARCKEDGAIVPNATVSVKWSGLFNYTMDGVTGDQGAAYFYSVDTRSSGYVIFTVTDITAPGYVYDPSQNYGNDAIANIY